MSECPETAQNGPERVSPNLPLGGPAGIDWLGRRGGICLGHGLATGPGVGRTAGDTVQTGLRRRLPCPAREKAPSHTRSLSRNIGTQEGDLPNATSSCYAPTCLCRQGPKVSVSTRF